MDLLIAWERQTAWLTARVQPALIAVGRTVETAAEQARHRAESIDMPIRAAFAEIAAAIRIPELTAQDRLLTARTLTGDLTAVLEALTAGEITFQHAFVIVQTTASLTAQQQIWVADQVLPAARHQTVAQLRRCLRRAILIVEPRTAAARAKKAHKERTLEWWPLPDGMACLRLTATATEVMAAYTAADTLARTMRHEADPGAEKIPLDALRSDALIALICGTPQARAATTITHVSLTIDLPTLLGLRERPAELAGYGPLPTELARILAADGKWRRLIHDPHTGRLLDLGHTTYQPSAALTRHIQARDGSCAFPTCNRTAAGSDLDHTRKYAPNHPGGGRTDADNLGPLCKTHHRLKHESPWTLRRDPGTCLATWTSATGHQYPVAAHDYTHYDDHDLPPEPDIPADAELRDQGNWHVNDDFHQLPDPIAPMDDLSYEQEPDDEYALV